MPAMFIFGKLYISFLGLGLLAREQYLLVLKFFFKIAVDKGQITYLAHDLSHYAHESLILFFTFLLMVLEKVIVRLEDWQVNALKPTKRS